MPTLREIFSDIADAIRTKTGKSVGIYPVDMASEIERIESGGDYKLEKMPSGAISSFNDGAALPLNNLKISIEPVQSGSGDPSPSNVRPISGWDEVNIVVSPTTDAEDGTTYNVQFKDGSNPLTVYGGTLDVTSGELVVDRGFYTISSNTALVGFTESSSGSYAIISSIGNQKANISRVCAIASEAKGVSYNDRVAEPTIDRIFTNEQGGVILRASNNVSISDSTTFLSYFNGCQICYELATPQTYQLNPTAVKSLLGTNNIWVDTGDIINGEYFKGAESSGSGIIYYIKNIRIECEVI